jgi:DNA invertase Pin-like site-specific DNA recombinase
VGHFAGLFIGRRVMARGRKRTTGKYQTVEELEEMVQFFSQTQGEFQTARTCGVSPTTVKNILARNKEKRA